MPARTGEIRDHREEEKQETREKTDPTLKAYTKYHKDFEAARQANKENPPTPKEQEESLARIRAAEREAQTAREKRAKPTETPENETPEAILQKYQKYYKDFEAARQENRENPENPQPAENKGENSSHTREEGTTPGQRRTEENITPPAKNQVNNPSSSDPQGEQHDAQRHPQMPKEQEVHAPKCEEIPDQPTEETTPPKEYQELAKTLAKDELGQALLDKHGYQAYQQLEATLDRHPYLRDRETSKEGGYTNALWAQTLKQAQQDGALASYTYKRLEDATGIEAGAIRSWLTREKEPHLHRSLRIHEQHRTQWETHLPPEAKPHITDPTTVYHTFRHLLRHPEQQTPENMAQTIHKLYQTHKDPPQIIYAELKPYHKAGPRELRKIARNIHKHRETIETRLNQITPQEPHQTLKIATDLDTLYIWRKNTDPDHWPNTYQHELFYLTPGTKQQLINQAKQHLNTSHQGLAQLAIQTTQHPTKDTKTRPIPHDLFSEKHSQYLRGETLHILLDATGKTIHQIQPHITRIGRIGNQQQVGGIKNPQFPTGETLNQLRARLYAITASDGHIVRTIHSLNYLDSDPLRVEYVKQLFKQLGNIHYNQENRPDGRIRLTMASVAGRLLNHWGIPMGDKALHPNFRLPKTIREGTSKTRAAYLQELTPEDGYFYKQSYFIFGVKRATILDAGDKAEQYHFTPKITSEQKDFLQEHGIKEITKIRDDKPRTRYKLTKTRLHELQEKAPHPQIRQTAKQLTQTIHQNPCKLLEDEKTLCQSLGIHMRRFFREIILHETDRVSVIWEIYTKSKKDTQKWATIAPPSSGPKRKAVEQWLEQQKEKRKQPQPPQHTT